jgi:hypothetical protein
VPRFDLNRGFAARLRSVLLLRAVGDRALDPELYVRCRRRQRSAYAAWFVGRHDAAALLYRATLADVGRLLRSAHPVADAASPNDWLLAQEALQLPLSPSIASGAAQLLSGVGETSADTLDTPLTADRLKSITESLLEAPQLWPDVVVRRERVIRCAAMLALILMPLCVVAWRLWPQPTNLARGKPVSGVAAAYDTSLSGVTDGIVVGSLGFHSVSTTSPWLIIDLGRVVDVRSVRVYPRGDCCPSQSLPLELALSVDEKSFHALAERHEPFVPYQPWTVHANQRARFVKLAARTDLLVISEVEVFGD